MLHIVRVLAQDARRALRAMLGMVPALVRCGERMLEVSGVITLSGTVVLLLAATAFVLYWLSYAAQHAGFVAYGLAVVLTIVVNAVIAVLNIVRSILMLGSSMSFVHFDTAVKALEHPDKYCGPYNSYGGILSYLFALMLSRYTCPVLRFTYSTWLHAVLAAFIGWTSFSSNPEHGNCHADKMAVVCVYIVNCWRLPVMGAALIVITTLIGPCMPLVTQTVVIAYDWLTLVRHVVFELVYVTISYLHKEVGVRRRTRPVRYTDK